LNRRTTIALSGLFALLYVLVFYLVSSSFFFNLDVQVFVALNALSLNPVVAAWSDFVTQFGSEYVLVVVAAILYLLDRSRKRPAIELLAVIAICDVLIFFWKGGYYRPRPFQVLPGVNLPLGGLVDSGFPSAHALRSFAVSCVIVVRFGRRLLPIFLVSILVCVSRVTLGLHFPSDVAGGALLGLCLGLLLPLVSDIVRKPSAMQRADMQAKEVVGTTPASSKTVLTANRMKG
jgi:undecaprenyl-diphosphatase